MATLVVRCTLSNLNALTTQLRVTLTVNGIVYPSTIYDTSVLVSGVLTISSYGNGRLFANGDSVTATITQGAIYSTNPGVVVWGASSTFVFTIVNAAIVQPNMPDMTISTEALDSGSGYVPKLVVTFNNLPAGVPPGFIEYSFTVNSANTTTTGSPGVPFQGKLTFNGYGGITPTPFTDNDLINFTARYKILNSDLTTFTYSNYNNVIKALSLPQTSTPPPLSGAITSSIISQNIRVQLTLTPAILARYIDLTLFVNGTPVITNRIQAISSPINFDNYVLNGVTTTFKNGDTVRAAVKQGTAYINNFYALVWSDYGYINGTVTAVLPVVPNPPSGRTINAVSAGALGISMALSGVDANTTKLKYQVNVISGGVTTTDSEVTINYGAMPIVTTYNSGTAFAIHDDATFLVKVGVPDGVGGFIYSTAATLIRVILDWPVPPVPGLLTNTISVAAV